MNTYPHHINEHEATRKQLWLAAYTALLGHLLPAEAIKRADEALTLADARWTEPEWVQSWQYKHNYPVGHKFVPLPGRSDSLQGTVPIKTSDD